MVARDPPRTDTAARPVRWCWFRSWDFTVVPRSIFSVLRRYHHADRFQGRENADPRQQGRSARLPHPAAAPPPPLTRFR